MSAITAEEYRDLLTFFSDESSAHNIVSLALMQINETAAGGTSAVATAIAAANSATALNIAAATVAEYNDEGNFSLFNMAANNTNSSSVSAIPRISSELPTWLIPCYSILLVFAIVGNSLVISTLVKNRRMRTITNLFLLNLAISDILLGVLCMPVTLVGTLLRHFIFGEFLCKLIQFSQAASVAVSSWTLVAISCERYYAICHPLRSRSWQTIQHAYRIITFIWFGSILCMMPIAIFSQLMPTSRQGLRKCREQWPEDTIGYERSYNIFLDLILLVLPLIILCVAYFLITRTLYVGMKNERAMIFGSSGIHRVNTQVEAVATVTTTLMPSVTFNTIVPFHTQSESDSSNNVAGGGGEASDIGGPNGIAGIANNRNNTKNKMVIDCIYQQQQQQQQPQQPKSYGDNIQTDNIKGKLLATATNNDDRRHLYCVRSTSMKSVALQQRANNINIGGSSDGGASAPASTSMTVIKLPQQQRFKLHQQRQLNHQQQQQPLQQQQHQHRNTERRVSASTPSMRITEAALRRSNETKNLESKKRVVKMLFVLVLEFFICWTPLYVINTLAMFIGPAIYEYIDYTQVSFLQLLAYSSCCCNPITYCFMNAGFRRAFLETFKGLQHLSSVGGSRRFWHKRSKNITNLSLAAGNSIAMANSATIMSNNTALHGTPRL